MFGLTPAGASWHVDPFLTSAWNSLIVGEKRWALYPPGRTPPGLEVEMEGEDADDGSGEPQVLSEITSLQWYLEVYPHLKPEEKPMEITQQPGETIFIPSGWWHCVLNLQHSVAVTQVSLSWNHYPFLIYFAHLSADISLPFPFPFPSLLFLLLFLSAELCGPIQLSYCCQRAYSW